MYVNFLMYSQECPAPPRGEAFGLFFRRELAPHAPRGEQRLERIGDEEARAVAVIALGQQRVVIGHGVAGIGHERQPGRILGRRDGQARAVERVIDHRGELMRREARGEVTKGGGDGGAGKHGKITPSERRLAVCRSYYRARLLPASS